MTVISSTGVLLATDWRGWPAAERTPIIDASYLVVYLEEYSKQPF